MSELTMSGTLTTMLVHRKKKASVEWRLRNALRWAYIWGWISTNLAILFSRITGIVTVTTQVSAKLLHDGEWMDYGVLGRKCVTTTGVNWIVDCWQGTYNPNTMKYHGCGTGAVAEAIGDTTLGAECTTVLNPDNTRATGSLAEGATSNIFSSAGTLTFDGGATVTEHGILNQAATGGGTLWDRTVFAGIAVVSTDTLQFTYQITFTQGG
jgi:hypothetical protein